MPPLTKKQAEILAFTADNPKFFGAYLIIYSFSQVLWIYIDMINYLVILAQKEKPCKFAGLRVFPKKNYQAIAGASR